MMGAFNAIDIQVREVCDLCGMKRNNPGRCKGCKIYVNCEDKQVVVNGMDRKVEQVIAGGGYRK